MKLGSYGANGARLARVVPRHCESWLPLALALVRFAVNYNTTLFSFARYHRPFIVLKQGIGGAGSTITCVVQRIITNLIDQLLSVSGPALLSTR
jgi:hypothetical protein